MDQGLWNVIKYIFARSIGSIIARDNRDMVDPTELVKIKWKRPVDGELSSLKDYDDGAYVWESISVGKDAHKTTLRWVTPHEDDECLFEWELNYEAGSWALNKYNAAFDTCAYEKILLGQHSGSSS